ncbi:hypothetical protein RAS2_28260 [Phycisphaerae bacterium RAS2]|nr:hypothetical protein RAS2_28260 [Phycisphaerae bacterium RAS2]
MDWDDFTIGFWHPFGAHGSHPDGTTEEGDDILLRKASEIDKNKGWTLWSFQHHSKLAQMIAEIEKACPRRVFALCSASKNPKPPKGNVRELKEFQLSPKDDWQVIPAAIRVPHPIGEKSCAAAFRVKQIREFQTEGLLPDIRVEWYSTKTGRWNSEFPPGKEGYPPRPELLIRQSTSGAPLRPVRAVLELSAPYVVTLK